MKSLLTKRQRAILETMKAHQHEEDGELVMDGGEVWIGLERTSVAMLYSLLRLCAINQESVGGGSEVYVINGTGLKLLAGNDEDLRLVARAHDCTAPGSCQDQVRARFQ